jgi:hypothetical protein
MNTYFDWAARRPDHLSVSYDVIEFDPDEPRAAAAIEVLERRIQTREELVRFVNHELHANHPLHTTEIDDGIPRRAVRRPSIGQWIDQLWSLFPVQVYARTGVPSPWRSRITRIAASIPDTRLFPRPGARRRPGPGRARTPPPRCVAPPSVGEH